MENPAETSAPDPERANEMLVLRCPPCHRQAGSSRCLGLQPGIRNGQITSPKKGASNLGMLSKQTLNRELERPMTTRLKPTPAAPLPTRPVGPINPQILIKLKGSTESERITVCRSVQVLLNPVSCSHKSDLPPYKVSTPSPLKSKSTQVPARSRSSLSACPMRRCANLVIGLERPSLTAASDFHRAGPPLI